MTEQLTQFAIVFSRVLDGVFPEFEFEKGFNASSMIDYTRHHLEIPIFAVSIYLVMVFWVPGVISKPLNLKMPFAAWNLILSAFSLVGMCKTVPILINKVVTDGFVSSICTNPDGYYLTGGSGFWVGLFIYSKIPELLDTAFLVFQKKQVIFLHWFHHTTVLLYCWHSFHQGIATGLWFAGMNFSVHFVMYFYYFLQFCGLAKFARPFAPLITMIQILQMVVGSTVTASSAYYHTLDPNSCHVDPANYKLGLGMYLSYMVLFASLFYNNYVLGKHRRAQAGESKNRQQVCGVEVTNMDGAGFFHENNPSAQGPRASEKKNR